MKRIITAPLNCVGLVEEVLIVKLYFINGSFIINSQICHYVKSAR